MKQISDPQWGRQVMVICNGCSETFRSYRERLPEDMKGYCANTGKRENMKTR